MDRSWRQEDDHRGWARRASPLARLAWLWVAVLIAYGGLLPWSGWRDLGVNPFAFVTAPLPRHLTRFDLALNVLAFVPLGALGVLALHPRVRGVSAVLLAALAGTALSFAIESLQIYLPRRVPSNVDLATNALGAMLGAALTAPWAAAWIDRGRLAQLRARWFVRDGAGPLLVLALWPLAQVAPTPMLFGTGEARAAWDAAAQVFGAPWPPFSAAQFGPAEFVLAEAVVVSAALFAVGLSALALMTPTAPRRRLLLVVLVAALLARTLAWGAWFGPERATGWLTPGAVGGLLLGGMALAVASLGTARWALLLATVALLIAVVAVNAVPANPFFADAVAAPRPGRVAHADGLARWVSVWWPYVLLAVIVARWVAGGRGRR